VQSSTAISTAAVSAVICSSLRRRGTTASATANATVATSTTRRIGVSPSYRPQIVNGAGRSAW
jgi:hypothetical protein